MLEQMVKGVIDKTIAKNYPHSKLPAVIFAVIAARTELADTFEIDKLIIYNDDAGSSYKGRIEAHWYEYTLSVLDRFGNVDADFPVLPVVKSKIQFDTGATVAIGLSFGDLTPVMIGEVIL